jgi:hypothetical protein
MTSSKNIGIYAEKSVRLLYSHKLPQKKEGVMLTLIYEATKSAGLNGLVNDCHPLNKASKLVPVNPQTALSHCPRDLYGNCLLRRPKACRLIPAALTAAFLLSAASLILKSPLISLPNLILCGGTVESELTSHKTADMLGR